MKQTKITNNAKTHKNAKTLDKLLALKTKTTVPVKRTPETKIILRIYNMKQNNIKSKSNKYSLDDLLTEMLIPSKEYEYINETTNLWKRLSHALPIAKRLGYKWSDLQRKSTRRSVLEAVNKIKPLFEPAVKQSRGIRIDNKYRKLIRDHTRILKKVKNQKPKFIKSYPVKAVSLDTFRREEASMTSRYNKKSSSFMNLFELRIKGLNTMTVSIIIHVNIELPKLNEQDMYKFAMYTLLKNNFTLLSGEYIKALGFKIIYYKKADFLHHKMGALKLESY